MTFEYFKYPEKFAFLIEKPMPCSTCEEIGVWFDAGGYSGVEDIDCICYSCLKSGKLFDLEIEANINFDDGSDAAKTITYKTPALPAWQDTVWPIINGEFPVFECIASKEDFQNKDDFLYSFIEGEQKKDEIEWIWDSLPDKKLNKYSEGGDISVYLFSLNNEKHWVWDAS